MDFIPLISSLALMATAVFTVLTGARRAYNKRGRGASSLLGIADGDHQVVTMTQALMFPIVGSAVLVTMYLFFSYLDWFFVAYIIMLALGSIAYCIYPVVHAVCAGPPSCLRPSPNTAASLVAGATVFFWIITGHWALNNIIGVGVCVALISVMRIPSLKVAAVALLGLLVYDVYWVFLSPAHFKESVMVAVATQQAVNPIHSMAQAVPGVRDLPPAWLPAPKLQMPNKLSIPVWELVDTSLIERGPDGGPEYGADPEPDPSEAKSRGASALHPQAGEDSSAATPTVQGEQGDWAPDAGAAEALAKKPHPRPQRYRLRPGVILVQLTATLGLVFAGGFTFLGLGDIALPGLLLAFAHKIDLEKEAAAEGGVGEGPTSDRSGYGGGHEEPVPPGAAAAVVSARGDRASGEDLERGGSRGELDRGVPVVPDPGESRNRGLARRGGALAALTPGGSGSSSSLNRMAGQPGEVVPRQRRKGELTQQLQRVAVPFEMVIPAVLLGGAFPGGSSPQQSPVSVGGVGATVHPTLLLQPQSQRPLGLGGIGLAQGGSGHSSPSIGQAQGGAFTEDGCARTPSSPSRLRALSSFSPGRPPTTTTTAGAVALLADSRPAAATAFAAGTPGSPLFYGGSGLRGVALAMQWAAWDTLRRPSYLRTTFLGYVAGLLLSVVMSRAFQTAQPALLYLVPCTLIPLCAHALQRGEMLLLWQGTTAPPGSVAPPVPSTLEAAVVGDEAREAQAQASVRRAVSGAQTHLQQMQQGAGAAEQAQLLRGGGGAEYLPLAVKDPDE